MSAVAVRKTAQDEASFFAGLVEALRARTVTGAQICEAKARLKNRVFALAFSHGVDGNQVFEELVGVLFEHGAEHDHRRASFSTFILSKIKTLCLCMAAESGRTDEFTGKEAIAEYHWQGVSVSPWRLATTADAVARLGCVTGISRAVALRVVDGKDSFEIGAEMGLTQRRVRQIIEETTAILALPEGRRQVQGDMFAEAELEVLA